MASRQEEAMLTFQEQSRVCQRREELEHVHQDYLDKHGELQQVLHDFMQALLIHKPEDTLAFMKEYFVLLKGNPAPYTPP